MDEREGPDRPRALGEFWKEERVQPPMHPGELLRLEFLEPLGLSEDRLAEEMRVPVETVRGVVREQRAVDPDTAARLGRYFGLGEGYWMRAQAHYEREIELDRREREAREALAYYMGLPHKVEVTYDAESEHPWFAKVPELPGCMTWAETREELEAMVEDAKRTWIECSLEYGDPIPDSAVAEGG